ncbi:hypothetical protein KFK09_018615 [Dendrobium nobile]|uniref:Uncharacterized protein n=1 Tax=Dendrobium nobile TaxID=94219 RepID=A0A8T3AVA2_DENNO|nr:hypothetical protein KFK09_018615 [Dendrobium nobile]
MYAVPEQSFCFLFVYLDRLFYSAFCPDKRITWIEPSFPLTKRPFDQAISRLLKVEVVRRFKGFHSFFIAFSRSNSTSPSQATNPANAFTQRVLVATSSPLLFSSKVSTIWVGREGEKTRA